MSSLLSEHSLVYSEFATTDPVGIAEEFQNRLGGEQPALHALHDGFKPATIMDYAFACKHGYIYACLQSFTAEELEAAVDAIEFWQFPTAWSRAVTEEVAFKRGDYAGPVLGPIARDGAMRLMRVRNTFNAKVVFPVPNEHDFFHTEPALFVLPHHSCERPSIEQRHVLPAYLNSYVIGSCIMRNAFRYGELDIIRYLHTSYSICDSLGMLANEAATNGHLDCLKYLHDNNGCWGNTTCAFAAANGHLDCLKYLHENSAPWDTDTARHAGANNNIECLKYLHENGCPWDESVVTATIYSGAAKCLNYVIDQRAPLSTHACSMAARMGHLDILQRLRDLGCPWDHHTCAKASRAGHLDCLIWAHDNGCPWDVQTLDTSDEACLEFANANGCPGTWLDADEEEEHYRIERMRSRR